MALAARTAASSGMPMSRTATRTHAMRSVAEPAIVPLRSVATLPRTVTSWPPSEYSPSSRPVAIIESLIRMTLSAPKAANRRRTMDGWICTPSAISSGITSEWSNAAPMGPGLRWCSGGMALHRCVICRAPASMAAHAVS